MAAGGRKAAKDLSQVDPPPGAVEGVSDSEGAPVPEESDAPVVPEQLPSDVESEAADPLSGARIFNAGFEIVVEYAGQGYILPQEHVTTVPGEVADHVVGPNFSASGTHSLRGCVRITRASFDLQIAKATRAWKLYLERNPKLLELGGP